MSKFVKILLIVGVIIGAFVLGFLVMKAQLQNGLGATSNTREWVFNNDSKLVRSLSVTQGTLVSNNGSTATTSPVAFEVIGSSLFDNATATNLAITGLTSGNCVEASTGGHLISAAAACGTGSGGGAAWELSMTGAISPTNTAAGVYVRPSSTIKILTVGSLNATSTMIGTLNLSGGSITNYFDTACTGLSFLQDIADNGAFTCASSAGQNGAWQQVWANGISPTNTSAGIFVNASSTFNSTLRVNNTLRALTQATVGTTTPYQGFPTILTVAPTSTTHSPWLLAALNDDSSLSVALAEGGYGFFEGEAPSIDLHDTTASEFGGVYMSAGELHLYGGTQSNDYITFDDPVDVIEGIASPLIPIAHDQWDLGSQTFGWAGLWLGDNECISFNNIECWIGDGGADNSIFLEPPSGGGVVIRSSSTTIRDNLKIGGNATTSGALVIGTTVPPNSPLPAGSLFVGGNSTTTATSTTRGLKVENLISCDTVNTTAEGHFICGTDDGGAGGSPGAWEKVSGVNALAPTSTANGILVNAASSTVTVLNMNTATTSIGHTFGQDGAGDSVMEWYDTNVVQLVMGIDDSANQWVISDGSVLGTADVMQISYTGSATTTGDLALTGLTQATAGTNNALCMNGNNEVIEETTGACVVSSRLFKHDIKPLEVSALSILRSLKPVSFSPNEDEESDFEDTQYGLVAEDVAMVDPHLAQYGLDGLPRTLDDRAILALVVKAMQEQQETKKFNPWNLLGLLGMLGFLPYLLRKKHE